MLLEDIVIILSRPCEPGNVGAVCRAMKNMGLQRLRIAGDCRNLKPELILSRAVHAGDVWEGAEFFGTLEEALSDRTLVIGTTRRGGKRRKSFPLTPAEAACCLGKAKGKGALVFGNEQAGLNREELELCTLASCIPAGEDFPSLNLSHALQIYAYELFLHLGKGPQGGRWEALERKALDSLVQSITGSLEELGFYKQPGRAEQERFFRDLLSRAGITVREGRYLEGIFRKAAKLGAGPPKKTGSGTAQKG
jgi:tRNA/rRNA methyltransferase/tRNA (cytidine32/uridine32-2'-O)-methyltransferase